MFPFLLTKPGVWGAALHSPSCCRPGQHKCLSRQKALPQARASQESWKSAPEDTEIPPDKRVAQNTLTPSTFTRVLRLGGQDLLARGQKQHPTNSPQPKHDRKGLRRTLDKQMNLKPLGGTANFNIIPESISRMCLVSKKRD